MYLVLYFHTVYICMKCRTNICKGTVTFHNGSLIWANALKQCSTWLLAYPGACAYWGLSSSRCPPLSRGLSEALMLGRERGIACCDGGECTAMKGWWNSCSHKTLSLSPSQQGPVATSPSACLPRCSSHMTEEPAKQLGLGILVSRAIVCPLSLSPVCPRATPTDSQHQLIIATVAVKETHFGSDRLMTCKTCSYWVTSTSSGGSGCVTLALRTHYWADSLTH